MSSAPRVVIVAIGSELLAGDGVDTNSAWLSRRLVRLGYEVREHVSVPDDPGLIDGALRRACAGADVVITTGGLGPTSDDLTRECVAEVLGAPLELDEGSLRHIEALFARFGRVMSPSNRKQALLPRGARVLQNDVGTAAAFAAVHAGERETTLYVLPGVPREVYWLWDRYVYPELSARSSAAARAERTYRTVGIAESALGERLRPIEEEPGVEVRYAAEEGQGTIRVTLLCEGEERAQALWLRARELTGARHVAALGNDTLPEAVAGWLVARGLTVATAESCTGGRVAAALTGIPGISSQFGEGLVTYSNAAKTRLLGVPEELLAAHGAVSPEVARAMALGVRERAGADLGLGVTGIAGPGGGTAEKPVGLVHFAVAGPGDGQVRHVERRFPGDRALIQTRAAAAALDLIRQAAAGVDDDDATAARSAQG